MCLASVAPAGFLLVLGAVRSRYEAVITVGVTICDPRWVWPPILNKPMKRAKLIVGGRERRFTQWPQWEEVQQSLTVSIGIPRVNSEPHVTGLARHAHSVIMA